MKYEPIQVEWLDEDEEYRLKLRRLAQTDLFFLAKYVLGYKDVTEFTHGEVARFFVQKNPDVPLADQDKIKRRLLLMPRGTFKTTFNICDTVQWIICFPDLAIMVMTAANNDDSPLADQFVDEVAQHFWKPKEGQPDKILLKLFPEYIVEKRPINDSYKGWFETPARKHWRREPTIMGISIEQSLSGWHFDVGKIEDIQDNRNSQTAAARRKLKKNLFINLKMLMSWGYREMTGTRYGPDDVYNDMIEALDARNGKLMWKPAMTVKEEVFKRNPKLRERADDYEYLFAMLKERDWKLFFPEFLPYDALMASLNEDRDSFMSQQMNIAMGNFKPMLSKERLMQATLGEDAMPIHGETYIKWRFELNDCKTIAGAVGILDHGRMYVMEIVRGTFTDSSLASAVVELAKRYHTNNVSIEETPGARYMETAIRNEAIREVWPLDIQWLDYQKDGVERSRRIRAAEPAITTGRVIFSSDIACIKETHRQLHLYGIVDEFEIADVVSRLCESLPRTIQANTDGEQMDTVDWELLVQRDRHDRLYGRGTYAPQEEVVMEEEVWEPAPNSDGLEEMMPGLES